MRLLYGPATLFSICLIVSACSTSRVHQVVIEPYDDTPNQEPEASVEVPIPSPRPNLARMKLGEYWYGMYLPDGSTEGYARLSLRDTKQEGVHCDWELHISGEGWKYEEERKLSFDKDWRMTFSEMSSGGQRVLGARAGNVMVGKFGVDDLRVEVKDDADTGMGFILAAAMQQKQGTSITRTEYNEAQGLKEASEMTISCGEQEEVELPEGTVKAWKYTLSRGDDGPDLPIWVNAAREIVQVDWGTNNLMKLHRESTKELFKPAPPFLTQLEPDDKTKLVLTADFDGFTLDAMWDYWATSEGLAKWWPQEAEVGGKVGEKYEATWRNEDGEILWQMQGKIETLEPKQKLGFTWKWQFDPEDAPTLHVLVEFKEVEGGVNVKITHSKFDPNNDDQQNRESLKQGWEQFCVKLNKLGK